jgi:uncharacterized protein with PIN domain
MRPRFLLDGMLGSLTRWLRICGYDSEYRRDSSDDELIETARRTGRILLTRDESLADRANKEGVEAYYLVGGNDIERLRLLSRTVGVELSPESSRCPKCNHELAKVEKLAAKGKVPEGTFEAFEEFWLCAGCGSVFWRGSHWPKITSTLAEASSGPGE